MGIEDTCRADCLDSIFGLWQLSYSTETARSIQELFTYMGPTPDGAKLCSKLISVLTVSDPELRWRAMQALFAFSEAIPGDDLIDQIVALIGHTSDEIRGLAVQVIQIWGDRVSAPMTKRLIGLSRDSCEDVRWRAAAALGAIRGSESTPMAVQRLNELAGDESETVRKSASAALVRLMVVRR
jgi:HEAT repeat protein